MTDCIHKLLKRTCVGDTHWYECSECRKKFHIVEWDGKVKIVKK